MIKPEKPFILSFVGHSNSGKTDLITRILPELKKRGIRVGIIKHAGSPIVIDQKGKDSHRHFEAGADPAMVCSDQHMAFFSHIQKDVKLAQLAQRYFKDNDLLITEGFKKEHYPKIEVYRKDNGAPPLCLTDSSIIGIVTDNQEKWPIPQYCLNDIHSLIDFIIQTSAN
ncbi:Molybdopterin-guanine dinucleotide biosynthesis protein B [Candidatus Magnetomorum sp. HK-1]|nr:Molybdopterin-guanine dinucleotide biosynthesis protein B [Candidatus Magnetomorum sp. HK-1]